jgi:polysaccharide biosynthesis protein PslH
MNQPRILYVTPVWPGHAATGVHVRAVNVLRALREIGTVETVFLDQQHADVASSSRPGYEAGPTYTFPVSVKGKSGFADKLRWTLDPNASYPHGWRAGQELTDRIHRILPRFDLVWFFKLRSPDAFPNTVWPRSVLDIDDLESRYESSRQQADAGITERLLTVRRQFAWKRREKLFGKRFTVLTVCSDDDRQYLANLGVRVPIHVIPNGFERPSSEPIRNPASPPRIGFIGPLDYFPNRDAIRWFVKECWPHIKRELPDARLRLAGPGTDGPLKPAGADVDGLGWLENLPDEISTWSLMVVPIRVGGGTRIKIALGFSQKCPIVSTSLGAFGYQVQSGNELYLADSAEAFSGACVTAIREPQSAEQMAERAWCQYLKKWTWEAIHPLVWAAAEDCMKRTNRTPRTAS